MNPADFVYTIDCHYIEPGRAAVYLVHTGAGAVLVDANTQFAVPRIIEAVHAADLEPGDISHVFITHAHLDHGAGTAALLKACPQAIAIAHPRAARHLVRPERLEASARQVYGDATFDRLYGHIEPCPADRVHAAADGEQLEVGDRVFEFLHTPGHATHHMSIHDVTGRVVFTGDAFGLSYAGAAPGAPRYVFCSCPPTDFDPADSRASVQRILDTGAQRAYPTHFGAYPAVAQGGAMLLDSIDDMAAILDEAEGRPETGDALKAWCSHEVGRACVALAARHGVPLSAEQQRHLVHDFAINGAGIAFVAERRRRRAARSGAAQP